MALLQISEVAPAQFTVEGDLSFACIDEQAMAASFTAIRGSDVISIDLAKVRMTDSAGLALMIEWIKHSRANQTRLIFKNIPAQLIALAKLSGFDENEYFSGNTDWLVAHNPDETHG